MTMVWETSVFATCKAKKTNERQITNLRPNYVEADLIYFIREGVDMFSMWAPTLDLVVNIIDTLYILSQYVS